MEDQKICTISFNNFLLCTTIDSIIAKIENQESGTLSYTIPILTYLINSSQNINEVHAYLKNHRVCASKKTNLILVA